MGVPEKEGRKREYYFLPPSKQTLYEDLIGIQQMINVKIWEEGLKRERGSVGGGV